VRPLGLLGFETGRCPGCKTLYADLHEVVPGG
jgi:hypothetical protein